MKGLLQRPIARWPRLLCIFALLGLTAQLGVAIGQEAAPPAIKMRRGGGSTLLAAYQWPRATLDQTVAGFTVEQGSAPAAFEYLFNRDHLIVGIELIEPVSKPAGVPFVPLEQIAGEFAPGPLRSALDEVVDRDPNFAWIEDDGVASLVYRANLDDPNYVFNRTVPSFDVDDLPYARAIQQILLVQHHDLGGWTWGFGLRHDPDGGPRVTIHVQQATVRRILNEIAWQAGLGWRVMYKQGDQMMGILITSQFSLEAECEGCPTAFIQPPAPPVISHLDEVSDAPSPSPSALLPLRDSLAQRGFAVEWNQARRQASASRGSIKVSVTVGATKAYVNNVPVALAVRPDLRKGRLYVPASFVALVVGRAAPHSAST